MTTARLAAQRPTARSAEPAVSAQVVPVGKISTLEFSLPADERRRWTIAAVEVVSPEGAHVAEPILSQDSDGGRHVAGHYALGRRVAFRPGVNYGRVVFYARPSDILRAEFTLAARRDPTHRRRISQHLRNDFF